MEPLDPGADLGLPEPEPMPPPVSHGSEDVVRARGWVIWALVAGLALVVAAGVLLLLYVQAIGDRDDAEQSLEEAETALNQSEADRDDAEQSLEEAETALNQSEADRDDAEAALAESEGRLGEAEIHLGETERAAIDFLAASMMTGTPADDEIAVCMANALYESVGHAILSQLAAVTNETDAVTADEVQLGLDIARAAEGCGTTLDDFASALDQTPTSPSTEPGQPAGQSAIEVVYAECAADGGKACAALLMLADSLSEEETFALTCGGRFAIEDAPLLCIGVSDTP